MSIEVGQVYASTHSGDVARGTRQRRRVVAVDMAARKAHLVTEDGPVHSTARPSTVTLRSPESHTIPGHRLVEDAPEYATGAETFVWADGTIYDPSIPGYREATADELRRNGRERGGHPWQIGGARPC